MFFEISGSIKPSSNAVVGTLQFTPVSPQFLIGAVTYIAAAVLVALLS